MTQFYTLKNIYRRTRICPNKTNTSNVVASLKGRNDNWNTITSLAEEYSRS